MVHYIGQYLTENEFSNLCFFEVYKIENYGHFVLKFKVLNATDSN